MSSFTFPQLLLKAALTVCCDTECCEIRDVYIDIKDKSTPQTNYWAHPDFVLPLKDFVKWFNSKNSNHKISRLEAHEVLDAVYGSD